MLVLQDFSEKFFANNLGVMQITVPQVVMMLIAFILMYLAIIKKYEPLLILPLAFGIMIANIPLAGLSSHDAGGLMNFLYQGISKVIYPPLIFLCLGAMTDFGPLIASPKTALIGIGGQLGIFAAFGIYFLVEPLIPGESSLNLIDRLKDAAAVGIFG